MKIRILISIVILIISFAVYLFIADFSLVKNLIGYNVPALAPDESGLPNLSISDGVRIEVFADGLEGPRVIAFDSSGKILISETKAGRVTLLDDENNDGSVDNKKVLIEGLKSPHGLAFYKKSDKDPTYLYIAEEKEVKRYSYDVKKAEITDKIGQNIATFPEGGRHTTRTISFGQNFRKTSILVGKGGKRTLVGTKLYISVGSSCDVCVEQSWKRAAILESDPEGTFTAEFAGGLRNAVFFTFHPKTKEIWATEMGRDNLGDDLPPDEINIVKVAEEEHKFGARRYGWPFCYGNKIEDKTFKPEKVERIDIPTNCAETEAPIIEIQAHSAPLGLAFIPSNKGWPKEWQGNLLVALHGSWNRSDPVGYKIVRYDLDENGKVLSLEPVNFLIGWLKSKEEILGRPVDLKFSSDGSLYVSDDASGTIYKISPR